MGGMNNPPGTPRDDGEMGGNFLNPFQSESVSRASALHLMTLNSYPWHPDINQWTNASREFFFFFFRKAINNIQVKSVSFIFRTHFSRQMAVLPFSWQSGGGVIYLRSMIHQKWTSTHSRNEAPFFPILTAHENIILLTREQSNLIQHSVWGLLLRGS